MALLVERLDVARFDRRPVCGRPIVGPAVKRQIEALPLNRHVEPSAHQRARAANERGLHALREGHMAEAVQAFQAAYQLAPTDVEILNKYLCISFPISSPSVFKGFMGFYTGEFMVEYL